MAWAPDYLTVTELKSALGITGTADDDELGFAITAASRAIDHAACRQFGLVASAEARYYTATAAYHRAGGSIVVIDDLQTTTGLVVKEDADRDGVFEKTLVLDTDFRLYSWNAAVSGRPWTEIRAEPSVSFTCNPRGFEVTGRFGWTTVPTIVKQACLTQAGRFFKRKDSPMGVAGSPELGSEIRLLAKLDPDVAVAVSTLARYDEGFA